MKRDRLYIIALILLALAFLISSLTLAYYITHRQDITSSVQQSVKNELSRYQLSSDNISVDDSKVLLAVAKYCQANDCRGLTGEGTQGPQGPMGATGPMGPIGPTGLQGIMGLIGDTGATGATGPQGEKGDTGDPGQTGAQGAPAPRTERRCNAELSRVEWRNEGDESWQPEYNLAPLQTCPNLEGARR